MYIEIFEFRFKTFFDYVEFQTYTKVNKKEYPESSLSNHQIKHHPNALPMLFLKFCSRHHVISSKDISVFNSKREAVVFT